MLRSSSLTAFIAPMVVIAGCSARAHDNASTSEATVTGTLAMDDVLRLAQGAGLACDDNLVIAGAIAMAESSLNTSATNSNGPTGGCPNGTVPNGAGTTAAALVDQ